MIAVPPTGAECCVSKSGRRTDAKRPCASSLPAVKLARNGCCDRQNNGATDWGTVVAATASHCAGRYQGVSLCRCLSAAVTRSLPRSAIHEAGRTTIVCELPRLARKGRRVWVACRRMGERYPNCEQRCERRIVRILRKMREAATRSASTDKGVSHV